MKRNDFIVLLVVAIVLLPFFISAEVFNTYETFNAEHGMVMSFIKFAILATFGEVIGLRIRTGKYNQPGFGIVPRAIVWGFLGLTINMAFAIFSKGTPAFLQYMGVTNATQLLQESLSVGKILVALSISATLNLIYAPVMMTLHKITDTHILKNGGTVKGLLKPINVGEIMASMDWRVQWNFVFKKTIPFFWIPAHTITFILPQDYRVLFAAVLGIALGVLLAIASLKSRN
ncbi:MAG: Mpv17/PMP22 family protein [Bacteroidales bacterium]|nr:Mpv17/PMP22 family protein [Bacteroidales bacterium]MBN2749250.1 Mpv17/PMP22 family protein [Bacteroidales bacterium]